MLPDEKCFNEDSHRYSLHNAPEIPEPSPPSAEPAHAQVMSQRAIAHVLPISMTNIFETWKDVIS